MNEDILILRITYTGNVFNPESLRLFTEVLHDSPDQFQSELFTLSYTNIINGEQYAILIHDEANRISKENYSHEEIFDSIAWPSYDILRTMIDDRDGIRNQLIEKFDSMFPAEENTPTEMHVEYMSRLDKLSSEEIEIFQFTSFVNSTDEIMPDTSNRLH